VRVVGLLGGVVGGRFAESFAFSEDLVDASLVDAGCFGDE